MTAAEREGLAAAVTAEETRERVFPELILDDRTRGLIERRHGGAMHRRGWVVRRALVAADVVGILAAFAAAHWLFNGDPAGGGRLSTVSEFAVFTASLPAWLLLAKLYGLYDRDEESADHSTADEAFTVFNMLTVGAFAFFAASHLFPGLTETPFSKILLFWGLSICFVVGARVVARGVCRGTDAYVQNTLIVGAGHVGQQVARKLLHHPEYGVNVVGFVDEHPRDREDGIGELTILGETDELALLVQAYDIERVIVAFSGLSHTKTLAIVRDLNALDVQVDVVPRLFEVLGPHSTIHAAEGLPLVGLSPARLGRSSLALKRCMDIVGAVFGLVILSPFFAAVAIATKLDSRGPIFFRQVRVGREDCEFEILKFRTMSDDADLRKPLVAHLNKHRGGDDRMFKIDDDPRITRVGRILRKRSLDELPQLINVLRGEMSLVGPRPLIPEEHHYVDGWALRRLDLKPGMTGLWQVLGRDDIPFGEMVGLDYRYVTTWSIGRDFKLMFRTFGALARSSG